MYTLNVFLYTINTINVFSYTIDTIIFNEKNGMYMCYSLITLFKLFLSHYIIYFNYIFIFKRFTTFFKGHRKHFQIIH